jgi:hypothetical protein
MTSFETTSSLAARGGNGHGMARGLLSKISALAVAFAAWSSPGLAEADEVYGTRSNLLEETAHTIGLTMHYDHAQLVVRRTVHNDGDRHDQAVFIIDVPSGGVAAGLRTLGLHHGRPRWFDGELLEAELAAARYRELTGIGGYHPKDPALLSWFSQHQLGLQVFPVDPGGPKTIEYTLHLPTTYGEGRHRVLLPELGTALRPAEVVLQAAHRLDQLFVDDVPVGHGKPLTLDHPVEIALARRDAPRLDGRLASIPVGEDRVLVQYQMSAAAKLSQVPVDARVVVLIDTSRSLSEGSVKASIAAARAYLHHFSDPSLRTRAEVVTFAREPSRRFDAMVEVERVLADLETLHPKRANGSNVDDALARAVAILGDAPRHAARRIVLFTDTLTRSTIEPALLRTLAARSGAIVHIVTVHGAQYPALDRSDAHSWADVARSTGGVVWWGRATEDPDARDAMQQTFEELARPLRIDNLEVHVAGIPVDAGPSSGTLDEGEALSDLLISTQRARHLKLEGELWSRPIREVVTPSAKHGKLWAGLVFGTDLLYALEEPEMMRLAMHGGVVSPVTSYLAIEPGVRPSTEGLDWGTMGLGTASLGGRGGGGGGTGGGIGSRSDPSRWLQAELRGALERCGVPMARATATLETTRAEIADVGAMTVEGADATTHDCVRDEVWEIELPREFRTPFARWTVQSRS